MIILLSPAKTLEKEPPIKNIQCTEPKFIQEANYLAERLKKLTLKKLQILYGVNPDLARLNYERFQMWNKDFEKWPYSPALLTFKGEVYRGIEAWNFSDEELMIAQNYLRILSGLYGILRPLDTIQAYRLEMGTSFKNRKGANLIAFWKKALTKELEQELKKTSSQTLVNLASKEYSNAIDLKTIKARIIEINFKDFKNGSYKFLTAYGKHARGLMTRFIIQNQITNPEEIKAFDLGGYHLNSTLSVEDNWVFTRG